jgi:uncharacterized protein YjiS (DUF1127 family)
MSVNHVGMACSDLPRAMATPDFGRTLRRQWHRASGLLRVWLQRSRGRYELLTMSDRELHDIGVKRSDVLREARKPFWRP